MATLAELARLIGADVVGDPQLEVHNLKTIDAAAEGDLTFLANPKYLPMLADCRATAIIVGTGVEAPGKNLLVCRDPYLAFAKVLTSFRGRSYAEIGIHPAAQVAKSARVGNGVSIYPGCVVGENVEIGDNCTLLPNVVLYDNVKIGNDCLIHAGCLVREECRIGNRVILQPGAVIGSDGFGFAPDGEAYYKIPQVGIVVLEDDVEIGAGSCIDRAALGETRIKAGCKLDNMVQIAHNVVLGENSVMAAQSGIAGSTRVGRHATFSGQSGAAGHLTLGENVTIAGKGAATSDLASNQIYSGTPSIPHKQWIRSSLVFSQLPDMKREISALRKRLAELEEQLKESQEKC